LSYQSNYIIANLLYIHASGIILPIKIGEEMKDKEVLRKLRLPINQLSVQYQFPHTLERYVR
jgi:hypothetical protein